MITRNRRGPKDLRGYLLLAVIIQLGLAMAPATLRAQSEGRVNFQDRTYLEKLKEEGKSLNVVIHGWPNYDPEMLKKLTGFSHYQNRDLYNVVMLGQKEAPNVNIIYLTTEVPSEKYIRYLIGLGGADLSSPHEYEKMRNRLHIVKVDGANAYQPLAEKMLQPENKDALEKTRKLIEGIERETGTPFQGYSMFATNIHEKRLADALSLDLLGASPELEKYGTKAGSREIFAKAAVEFPVGVPYVKSLKDLSRELAILLLKEAQKNRRINKMIIKLNEGISGKGNEMVTVGDVVEQVLSQSTAEESAGELLARLTSAIEDRLINGEGPAQTGKLSAAYIDQIEKMGTIAEEFIEGADASFPSAQVIIEKDGRGGIISTHEQILGGPSGQIYLGCENPARKDYVKEVMEVTAKIARALGEEKVVGNLGVDYIVVKNSEGDWKAYPLEVNMRKLGTSHPFGMARLVTKGKVQFYTASDNKKVMDEKYIGLPGDVVVERIQQNPELHFNHETQEGVMVHLTGALEQANKIGVTCHGKSLERARQLCGHFQTFLDKLAMEYHQLHH